MNDFQTTPPAVNRLEKISVWMTGAGVVGAVGGVLHPPAPASTAMSNQTHPCRRTSVMKLQYKTPEPGNQPVTAAGG
jgi:hypothetical protein